MPTFEEGFATAESAADSVLKALNEAASIARQLRKASQDGNIAAVRRQSERLDGAVNLIRQEVANASTAWPFTAEDERRYLEEGYGRELQAEAEKRGLQVFERDGRLIAHPSMVRVLPGERAVRIDRRQSSAVRPSRVVADWQSYRTIHPGFARSLSWKPCTEAYLALAQSDTADRLKLGQVGQVIRLESMYKLFTGLPGSSRDYSQLDFARDLYALRQSGVREVRSGAKVSFPASTGTRSARGAISFIGPSGETVLFYGIQFTGGGQ